MPIVCSHGKLVFWLFSMGSGDMKSTWGTTNAIPQADISGEEMHPVITLWQAMCMASNNL